MEKQNVDTRQTIFSLVSGALPCAVAIVRLSGPDAFSLSQKLFLGNADRPFQRERGLWRGTLSTADGRKLDDILALGFVGPNSFTGEDIVELQTHGSVAIVTQLEQDLLSLGARPAERGEFSYRALLNGKLSSRDIENLGDLFRARDPQDLDRIYRRKDGALEKQIFELREQMIGLQAILDTAVDFSDEYSSVVDRAGKSCDEVIQGLSVIIHRYSSFTDGTRVPRLVLAGSPNAGKSSLFNALLCRYRAIVHEAPGTTRDVIEEDVVVEGRKWKLVDTAGFREAHGEAERQGISLGGDFLGASQFWLMVVDGSRGMSAEEAALLEKYREIPHLLLWNKSDLPDWTLPPSDTVLGISALTGVGLPRLWNAIKHSLESISPSESGPLPTATQSARLLSVLEGMRVLSADLLRNVPPEFLAEQNRALIDQLSEVVGDVSVDDVLGRIFSEFCIGK